MHGGAEGIGAPKGNRNALKHGRYTAEMIAFRRQTAKLIRKARDHMRLMRDLA
jgi:glucans biosynthesis protein